VGQICFCQVTYDEDEVNTKKCIENIRSYVDRVIIIQDGTLSQEVLEWLKDKGCEVYTHTWQDSTSIQRNQYLKKLQEGDWACVSDPDEVYDELLCKEIRGLIERAERAGVNQILLNCHDTWLKDDGSLDEHVSDYYKPLIFRYTKGLRYEGIIHETLMAPPHVTWKIGKASPKYFYRHIKSHAIVWRNAVRNMFCCGGGDNFIGNPHWTELRQICMSLGINTWKELYAYLKKGNIDERLKDWIIRHKDIDEEKWHSELREWYLYYFVYLHPEEAPTKEEIEVKHWAKGPPTYPKGGFAEFRANLRELYHKYLSREPTACEQDYFWGQKRRGLKIADIESTLKDPSKHPPHVYVAQQYHNILGREVDPSGFHTYSTLIALGKIKKEDLPRILRGSPEGRGAQEIGLEFSREGTMQKILVRQNDVMKFISEVFNLCSLMLQGKIKSFTIGIQEKEKD